MKSWRVPLYVRFLLWSALNLVIVAALMFAFAPRHQSGLNLFLTDSVQERLIAIARDVADDLAGADPNRWATLLAQHRELDHVQFSAVGFKPPGDRGPPPLGLPGPKEGSPRGSPPGPPPGAGDFGGGGPPPEPGPPFHRIDIHRSSLGFDVDIAVEGVGQGGPPRRFLITAHARDWLALLKLLGLGRELTFISAMICLSALLWWPFILSITRTIGRLSLATQEMSRGRLDTRVIDLRRDELGDLGLAINAMAERLEILLLGQRQFVADIAHEVISPVARMQVGLGILEGRVPESSLGALNDVREDLEQMAVMLQELLLFSRSGAEAERSAPTAIELKPLIDNTLSSEPGDVRVVTHIPSGLFVMAHAALLARALANIIRNARRYAGVSAPVEIAASPHGGRVSITVKDRGPGVPAAALSRLGEPFFRPEVARSRATGGFGLGLAIVRRCMAACGGEVKFNNREGGGFEAQLLLPLHTPATRIL
jgi:two-component system, OmpR family, sensor histidine kinase CpxA